MANPRNDSRRLTRTERLTVRFDDVEFARLTRFAATRTINVSALVRASVLDVVGGHTEAPTIAAAVEGPQVDSRDLVALRTAVNLVGGNLHQIDRLSKRHGVMVVTDQDDKRSCTQVLAETKATLDEVKDALGGSRRLASHELVALRVAVDQCGNDMNLIARLSNRHGVAVMGTQDDEGSYTQVLAATKAVLDEVKDALGGSRRP